MPQFLVISIFVVIAVVAIIYNIYATGQRRKELSAWALSKGLFFSPDKDDSFDSQYMNFQCLQEGHDRYARNVMQGALAGRQFIGCDYNYTTGSGKDSNHHHFSLVIVNSPIFLKPLLIRPENLLDKIAACVGLNDINFESAEFSKKFYVNSTDKKWAYDIIHPQMMEFLLASPVFSIQFDSLSVIVYRHCTFSPADFDAAVDLINGIFERIPDYVIQSNKLGQA